MRASFYSRFEYDRASKKTPKYNMIAAAGEYEPFKELKGKNGKVNLYLMGKRETQPSNAPAMFLQVVKTNQNFTGLHEYFRDGQPTGKAYGEPQPDETYKGKPNVFYPHKEDGYLFIFEFEAENQPPKGFEFIVVPGGRVMLSTFAKMLANGLLDAEVANLRNLAENV